MHRDGPCELAGRREIPDRLGRLVLFGTWLQDWAISAARFACQWRNGTGPGHHPRLAPGWPPSHQGAISTRYVEFSMRCRLICAAQSRFLAISSWFFIVAEPRYAGYHLGPLFPCAIERPLLPRAGLARRLPHRVLSAEGATHDKSEGVVWWPVRGTSACRSDMSPRAKMRRERGVF